MTDLSGKTIIITGGSSGIGEAAAKALSKMNAHVIITGRSPRTAQIAKEMNCDYFLVDFASFASVRAFAEKILIQYPVIDVLINNVGGVFADRQVSEDGHEMTLQVNHLSGFLLTKLLRERLEQSKAIVINTSSMANIMAKVKFKDMENNKRYQSMKAYGRAKLMNILHAMEISKRFDGVKAASFHPGVVSTGFAREGGFLAKLFYNTPLKKLFMISPEQGADTLVWLVTHPDHWLPGGYYYKRKPGRKNAQATEKTAKKLWEVSKRLVAGKKVQPKEAKQEK